MKRLFLSFFLLLINMSIFGQTNLVTIKGFAPAFVGKKIQVEEIEDYISQKTTTIASSTVENDSTFSMSFNIAETQRVLVKIENNRSFMYVQPKGQYSILFPQKDPRQPFRPAGNQVELTFFDLDSTDINYRILGFNRWMDNFLALNYADAYKNPVRFNHKVDSFKTVVENYYVQDTGKYIFDYVRFTIANTIDNIQQAGNRNRYEKHDFYIKHQKVLYQNDAYMDYFIKFYSSMMSIIPMEVNNRVYLGLLKSSPSLIMNALGLEYTLINRRIREMVMIKMLSELYYSPDYPQTNIITVLDSVKNNALFSANKIIAANVVDRLTEVVNGGKAPDFVVKNQQGDLKGLSDYRGKYLYIHFYNPMDENNQKEIPLLQNLYEKYSPEISFITICKESDVANSKDDKTLKSIKWDVAVIPNEYSIFSYYKITTFPQYVLIDPFSYIVQAPALGPQPNSTYKTIEKVFFDIQRAVEQKD